MKTEPLPNRIKYNNTTEIQMEMKMEPLPDQEEDGVHLTQNREPGGQMKLEPLPERDGVHYQEDKVRG